MCAFVELSAGCGETPRNPFTQMPAAVHIDDLAGYSFTFQKVDHRVGDLAGIRRPPQGQGCGPFNRRKSIACVNACHETRRHCIHPDRRRELRCRHVRDGCEKMFAQDIPGMGRVSARNPAVKEVDYRPGALTSTEGAAQDERRPCVDQHNAPEIGPDHSPQSASGKGGGAVDKKVDAAAPFESPGKKRFNVLFLAEIRLQRPRIDTPLPSVRRRGIRLFPHCGGNAR